MKVTIRHLGPSMIQQMQHVCQDCKGSSDDTGPSIAAVVANTDWLSANIYIAQVRAQGHRRQATEQHISDLAKEKLEGDNNNRGGSNKVSTRGVA